MGQCEIRNEFNNNCSNDKGYRFERGQNFERVYERRPRRCCGSLNVYGSFGCQICDDKHFLSGIIPLNIKTGVVKGEELSSCGGVIVNEDGVYDAFYFIIAESAINSRVYLCVNGKVVKNSALEIDGHGGERSNKILLALKRGDKVNVVVNGSVVPVRGITSGLNLIKISE